jgi:hypothetical protein
MLSCFRLGYVIESRFSPSSPTRLEKLLDFVII